VLTDLLENKKVLKKYKIIKIPFWFKKSAKSQLSNLSIENEATLVIDSGV